MNVLDGEDSMSFTPYNVVTNNCEHFASWAREQRLPVDRIVTNSLVSKFVFAFSFCCVKQLLSRKVGGKLKGTYGLKVSASIVVSIFFP